MLLVLAVLMLLTGIGIPTYKAFETAKEEQRFFDLLLHDIYFAQSESYRLQKSVGVIFREESNSYDVVSNVFQLVSTRKMPETVSLKKNSNIVEVMYWSTGSVMASGTLRFNTSSGEKTIVVHLGKGRVVYSG